MDQPEQTAAPVATPDLLVGEPTSEKPSSGTEESVQEADNETEAQDLEKGQEHSEEGERKRCCTKRTFLISIAVVVIIVILGVILYPKLIPQLTKKKAIKSLDVSDETKQILKQLNAYTNAVAAGLGPFILDTPARTDVEIRSEDVDLGWRRSNDQSASDYGWAPLEIVHEDYSARDLNSTIFVQQVRDTAGLSYDFIPRDDNFGVNPDFADTADFLQNERYVPMKDNVHYFESDDDRDGLLEDLGLLPLGLENGYLLPKPRNHFDELVSDEALSRMFWYGIGAVFIMGPEFRELRDDEETVVGFEINMDLSSLQVRKDFRRYGYRIHFGTDQKVTSIFDPAQDRLLLPEDGQEWEKAKFLVKQTTFWVVSVREHMHWSHLITSNSVSKASAIHLPPNHPLRRLLTVFTYRTNFVNEDALRILTPERGLFHRLGGFEYSSMLDFFDAGYKSCGQLQPFRDSDIGPGVLALVNEGKFPYYKEGLDYFMIVHQFVSDWLNEAGEDAEDAYALAFYEDMVASSQGQRYELKPYSRDNMIDTIAQFVWIATAFHEVVGTVADYSQLPSFMGLRVVQDGKLETDTESFLLGAYLTGMGSLRMPQLMAEFPNFFGQGDDIPDWEVRVWSDFQTSLRAQSSAVKEADAERIAAGQPEFKLLDPDIFECSISV